MAFQSKVTLRIYSKTYTLKQISTVLCEPTDGCSVGDVYGKHNKLREFTYWGLESKISLKESCDNHIKDILQFVIQNSTVINQLKESGCEIDLSCFLDSNNGQGGFTVSPVLFFELGKAELSVSFDFYAG
jgi:hypothetical protein